MALDLDKLVKIDSGYSRDVQQIYAYTSATDAVSAIVASGYFNNATTKLRQYDIIFIQGSTADDDNIIKVTSATLAAVVTTASIIDTSMIEDASITNVKVHATAGITVGKLALATGSVMLGTAGVGAALDVSTDTGFMVGNGTTGVVVTMSGDATMANTGAVTIAAGAVDAAMLALTTGSMLVGAAGAGAEIDVSTDTAVLIGNGTTGAMFALSGDVTMTNAGVVTIGAGAVDPAMQAITTGRIVIGAAGAGAELDVSTDTGFMVGNATTATVVTMSGDATMTNAGVVSLALPKVRAAVRHTWAGGVATTDTVTLTGVIATDVIHATITANSGVGAVVSAERSGADSVLVTTSANMANGDILSLTAIQVV